MPTPPKPAVILEMESRSHRTKAEIEQRKKEEKNTLSGLDLKERPEVKSNEIAHKEFGRIKKILQNIGKSDGIYEPVINRYCILQSECADFETKKDELYKIVQDLKANYDEFVKSAAPSEKALMTIELTKEITKLVTSIIGIDRQLQAKRKMLLEIETQNLMTIAAALRSIPKKEVKEKPGDELRKMLGY